MYDLLPSIGNADIFLRNSHMELSFHCPTHVIEDSMWILLQQMHVCL